MARYTANITLYKNIPFDDTYKHVVDWKNRAELYNYLDTFPNITMETSSYQALNKPVRWDTKQSGFNSLVEYNYLEIAEADNTGKEMNYFAFITDLEYLNDGTTLIYYSIDMWNTYMFNITSLGNALIERGFVKEVNEKNDNFTDLFKSTLRVKEDIGGDGCQRLVYSNPFYPMQATKNGNYVDEQPFEHLHSDEELLFLVFTAQPKDAQSEEGSRFRTYSQYRYYIVAYNPLNLKMYTLQVNGKEVYKPDKDNVKDLWQALSTDNELVGSSSLVVDVEQYAYIGIPYKIDYDKMVINFQDPDNSTSITKAHSLAFIEQAPFFRPQKLNGYIMDKNNTVFENVFQQIVHKLRDFYGDDVPLKIMAQPYMSMLVTDGRGTDLSIDLAKINSYRDRFFYLWRYGGIAENGKEVLALVNYMRDSTVDNHVFTNNMNAMAVNDSPKDIPYISDTYTMYLQSNRNQLRNTRANAKMNYILAKEGNAVNLANTNRSIDNAANVTAFQNGQRSKMAQFNMGAGIFQGAANGLMHGSLIGAVTGAAGGAISGAIGMERTNIQNQTAAGVTAMNNATNRANAAANYAFQNKVATNQYEQTLRTQNAMLADVKNSNDTIAHQGSNNTWEYQNGNFTPILQLYRCEWQTIENVITYFKLFGYSVGQYFRVSYFMHVKTNYNYVKTKDIHISGTMPQAAQDTINKMFDSGVTFWSSNKLDYFENRDPADNKFIDVPDAQLPPSHGFS